MSEAELSSLEANISVKIPPIYRTLLSLVGHNPNAIADWVGSDWNARDLLNLEMHNQRATRDLLYRNGALEHFPDDAFVFLLHQGYSFLYVEAHKGDDSPVFNGEETDEPFRPPRLIYQSLHDYMQLWAAQIWQDARNLNSLERNGV